MKNVDIVNNWIQYTKQSQVSGMDVSYLEDVVFEFEEILSNSADRAFDIIMLILEKSDDPIILSNLSAGPLESLLARHGDLVIEKIEYEANRCSKFKCLLNGVWENTITKDVWERVLAARS